MGRMGLSIRNVYRLPAFLSYQGLCLDMACQKIAFVVGFAREVSAISRTKKMFGSIYKKHTQQAKTVGKCVQLYWASCGRPKCRHDVELLFVFRVLLCSWSWSVFRVQGLWFCFRAGSYCTPTHSILQGFRRSFALLSLPYP